MISSSNPQTPSTLVASRLAEPSRRPPPDHLNQRPLVNPVEARRRAELETELSNKRKAPVDPVTAAKKLKA
jgi:hypothetical protein